MRLKLVAGIACLALSSFLMGCPLFEGPEAAFSATPTEGNVPLTVLFVDQSTAGSTDIIGWQWDFGDGLRSNAQNPSHVYTAPGSYRVTLTVTTRLGNDTETINDFITVRELPRANFTASPRSGEGPLQVTFSNLSTAGAAPITSYAWEFGDGSTSEEINPVHLYDDPGTYTVKLTVVTEIGESTETKANFITVQQRPTASFTASPTAGAAPLAVQFTDTSTPGSSPITRWNWDFGDGSTDTRQNPSHVYTAAGSYTVSLSVTSEVGMSPIVTQRNLIVVEELPRANFSASPTTGPAPLNVNFNDLSSGGSDVITEWLWDFGDSTSSTLPSPSHRYASDGVYDVSLTVTTSSGNTHTITKPSFITAQRAPDAAFSATPRNGEAPLTVQFTDLSDPGSAPITSWQWDFGDGSTSTDRNPFHSYSRPGRYNVTLGISTAVGSDTVTQVNYIQVEQKPVAAFSATPSSGAAPLAVSFADQSVAGSAEITAWSWEFGDGTSSTQQNPTKTYNQAGIYTVSLTVTSAAGSSTLSKPNLITVRQLPSADFSSNVTTGAAPLTVLFSDTSTAGSESLTGWAWDFGDGGTSTLRNPSKVYNQPGVYTVSLTASSTVGSDTETKTDYIVVRPAVNFSASAVSGTGTLTTTFTDTTALGPLDVVSRSWDFGDGSPASTEASPTHTYAEPGVYNVRLTLQTTLDSQSDTRTRTGYIIVRPNPAFTGDNLSGDGSLLVNFTNTTELGSLELASVLWNFGDGTTSQTENPSHTYTEPGTYNVALTVTTAAGSQTTTRTGYVTVRPVVDFAANVTSGVAPLTVAFTNTTPLGNLTITGRLWEFGDGTTSETANPVKAYAAPGDYDVTLTITTAQGVATASKSAFIRVAPTVSFTTDVDSGVAPLTVNFTSTTNAGSLTISAYSWNFGDGSAAGTGATPSHTYTTPGTYDVSLTVTTEQGDRTFTSVDAITVTAKSAALATSGETSRGHALLELPEGGFALAGALDAGGGDGWDAMLVLTDNEGHALPGWPQNFGGAGDQQAHDLVAAHGGGYVLAGVCGGPAANGADAYVVKLDANGELAWERRIGGPGDDVAHAAVPLSGGGYALAGSSAPGDGAEYAWTVLLDENGDVLTEAWYGNGAGDRAWDLVETASGDLAIAGGDASGGWVILVGADLNETARLRLPQFGPDGVRGIAASADSGFALAGATAGGEAGGPDMLLVRISADLDAVLWDRAIGGLGADQALDIAATASGGYLLAGSSDRGAVDGPEITLIRTDAAGNVLLETGTPGPGAGQAAVETIDGGAGVAAVSVSETEGEQAVLLRVRPLGKTP